MKARTYKKLLRLNQDEQERLRYLSKSTGLNQEQVLRKVLMTLHFWSVRQPTT